VVRDGTDAAALDASTFRDRSLLPHPATHTESQRPPSCSPDFRGNLATVIG